MTPEQKAKIDLVLEELNACFCDDCGDKPLCERCVELTKQYKVLTLANEPVGEDLRDAKHYTHYIVNTCECTGQDAVISFVEQAFLDGRKGMVPKSAVEDAVRSERERIIKALIDEERKEYIAVDMIYNEALFRGHYESIITPTNQGEKE